MVIRKPRWLERAFSYMNWEIFTWHIYIGDSLESAVDWVINGINWVIDLAQSAWNWIDTWYSKLSDWWSTKWKVIRDWFKDLSNTIDTWWSKIANWWSAKWSDVLKLTDTIKNWATSLIRDIQSGLNGVKAKLDNFFASTLPNLASINFVEDVRKWILKEISTPINSWLAVSREVTSFFTDPLKWFMTHFEKIIEDWW